MALELSTAGIKVKYCVGTKTRPTTGYSEIRGVKSIPSYNPEPSNLDVTCLADTTYKRYISGLKDPGGAIGLSVNFCEEFVTDWKALLAAYEAKGDTDVLWIEYAIPEMDSFYFQAIPSELGFNGAEVDSVLENVAYLTPNSEPVWAAASV